MKKPIMAFVVFVCLAFQPSPARADLFGGDVAVLSQILVQAVMQLQQLRNLLSTAKENVDLLTLVEWMDLGIQFSNSTGTK